MLAAHCFPVRTGASPVILLHGFASSSAEDFLDTGWAAALNAAGRPVIAIDLPGHGASPAIPDDLSATTAGVVDAVLDTIDWTVPGVPFDVIGYSLGARLAWELPAANPLTRRLVLGGLSRTEPFGAVDPDALARALDGEEPEHPLIGIMAGMISVPQRDTASLARLIGGLASQPFARERGGPGTPLLLAAGAEDELTAGAATLLDGLADASFVGVPGDHRGALDSTEFRAAAIAFLER